VTTSQAILEHLKTLPESAQREVLRFVELLETRGPESPKRQEDSVWSQLSLALAMQGMEDEESPYTLGDLKESFR
jgi:hypothetical protein